MQTKEAKTMRRVSKRIISLFLVLVMLLAMIPAGTVLASAASGSLDMTAEGLTATYAGDGTWTGGGNVAHGTVTGKGSLFKQSQSGSLTFTNTRSQAGYISFDYKITENTGSVTIAGNTVTGSGSYAPSAALGSGETVQVVIKSGKGNDKTTSIELTNINLVVDVSATTTFKAPINGSYTVNGESITKDTAKTQSSTVAYKLVAKPATGYNFIGWYSSAINGYFDYNSTTTLNVESDTVVYPVFVSSSMAVFQVGFNLYTDLNKANAAAEADSSKQIVLSHSGILAAGTYKISKGVNLLIPFDSANTATFGDEPECTMKYAAPTMYSCLTMADGAVINCYGNINVNATQLASSTRTAGRVCGAYGAIQMTSGSQIKLKSGSALYAYGYIGGEGLVWGESGSKVYQFMQIEDWRGGNDSSSLLSSLKNNSFLFSQYYLQNVEAELRIDSGCTMYGTAAIAAGLGSSKSPSQACAAIVGKDEGMFHITSGYATLKYDATTDRMTLDFYGDLVTDAISMSIKLTVVSSSMNTADYILALPMNYTINIKSGSNVTFAQKFKLLPGTAINVEKGATAIVSSGGAVYLYDVDDWMSGTYTYNKNIFQLPYVFAKKGAPVTRSVKENSVLRVDGTLIANGPIYSTKSVTNGGDAVIKGKGVYVSNVHGSTDLKEVTGSNTTLKTIACVPVRGTIAGHSGYNSFAIGTYRSLNGNCWYQRAVTANGFTVVSGGVQDGVNVYVADTKDATVTLVLTTEQPCVTLPTNAKVAVSGNKYTLTEIKSNVTIVAKQHNPVVSVPAKAPDCLNGGYTAEEKCSVCGTVVSPSVSVPATGHKEEIIPGKEATCTENGLTEGKKCSVCGEIIVAQEVIKAHGHSEKTVPGKAPTCTENGLTAGKVCSVCGAVIEKQEIIPATGHTYTTVVTAPTCEEDGYTTHTCACGYSYVDNIVKATGHSYTITVDGTYKAPTCTEDGKEADLKCAKCGAVKKGAVIPAKGHDEVIDAAVEPTCTKDGLTEGRHCKTCNEVIVAQKVVKALGHDYVAVVTPPTCTQDGYTTHTCSRCHDSYVDSHVDSTGTEHSYDSTKVYEPTCTEDGYTVKICSICGHELKLEDTIVPAYGHKFTYEVVEPTCTTGGYTVRKCTVCGYSDTVDKVDALGHDFTSVVTEPTCTEKGYTTLTCKRCNHTEIPEESYVPALGHKYVGVVTTPATCTENGVMTYTCHCGDSYTEIIPATNHSYDGGVVTAPTCHERGYTTYTCKKCGHTYQGNFVEALGCEFGDWVIVKNATCTENGLKKRTCIRGDRYETEVIPATGHSYTAVVTEPTCTERGYTTYTCHCGHSYVSDYTDASGHKLVIDPAVAPTCTESGLTEGSHCSVCGEIIVERQTVAALGHSFGKWTVSKVATCTEKGEEERYCTVCGIREARELAMLPHTPVIDAAVAPTYSSTGLTEGSHCSSCNEILKKQEVVAKLKLNWDTFKLAMSQLEGYASDYAKNNPGKDPTKLMLNFIRTGIDRYNDDDWVTMAGAEETVFVNEVIAKDEINGTIAYALREIDYLEITMPNGEKMVFDHLFGSLNISSNKNYTQSNTDFGSWAGDICDLMEYSNPRVKATELDAMTEEIKTKYFGVDDVEESGFGYDDIRTDLDAFYIVYQITSGASSLSEIFESYYNEELSMRSRAAFFLNNRFPGSLTNAEVRQSIFTTYRDHLLIQLLESGRGLSGLDTLREACCYAFADYLYNLAKDDLVAPEKPDKPTDDPNKPDIYSVFSSKDSMLAPGITQNISYAVDSNGEQMVYYMSKSDINRSDVNIYANYANNDASSWALSTVSEQMAAAQKKHSNPNDPDNYIENYNAVVGTNANFFNMGTGQPLGLLVMNGKEYTPIYTKEREYNFFAILKDGTPVIGEASEYNKYKNNIQEAVGGAEILVKDGVNQFIGKTSEKMPRCCVGITADGQIINLVLDGRQYPYSVGATYYEVAQILIDAGCVDAMELDGGGSATYDAKQEGSDEVTVVNRPCDSVERSVSSSLVIVSTAVTSKEFDHAIVNTATDYLTVGSSFDVSLTGVGAAGNMTEIPKNATLRLSDETVGTLNGNKFTAVAKGKVDIQVVVDGKVVGSKTIEVITRPTALSFTKDNINVIYGVAEELPLVATYKNNPVTFNTNDIIFEMTNDLAGVMNGFSFTGNEASGVRNVTVTAKVKTDVNVSANISLHLYKADESIFDFEKATAGNESLAWNRSVSNSYTIDNKLYYKVDTNKDSVASYVFAIDMKSITAPARLQPLMEYLNGFAGNVGENATPWDYLLALGGRVSDLTNVTVTAKFPEGVDVDVENLRFVNDFFKISSYKYDEATHTLTIVCKWTRQTEGIDPSTANSIGILSGVKITPKKNAQKDKDGLINIDVTGNVSYDIYLDTTQLYKFAKDPENQKKYGIYEYINPNDPEDAGGHFSDTYVTFEDHFSLDEKPLNGWISPNGEQFYYYVNNKKVTGIYCAPDQDGSDKSYYYSFDNDGACTGKLTGLFYDNTAKAYRYARHGELQKGWVMIDNSWYNFDNSYNAQTGSKAFGSVTYEFEDNGRLKHGVWAKTVFGTKYYYGPGCYNRGWATIDGNRYYFENGYRYEGYRMIFKANVRYWYDFGDDGICKDEVVPTGFYEDEKGLSYVIDGIGVYGLYKIDGSYYCFDYYGYARKGFVNVGESHCDLNPGNYYFGDDYKAVNGIAKNQNGDLVYYRNGRPAMVGLVEVDGDYYFAGGANGEVSINKKQYTWANTTSIPNGTYEFGPDGKMLNGIVEKDGTLYYYETGKPKMAGLVMVDGAYYFAGGANGEVSVNKVQYVWQDNGIKLENPNCEFGADGKMLDGIVNKNGTLYYYVMGRPKMAGLIEVDGAYYFAGGANGEISVNKVQYVWQDNGIKLENPNCEFGADGKMLDGIVNKNGTLYYYVMGRPKMAGLIEIDGDYYFAGGANGELAVSKVQNVWKANGISLSNPNCEFGADGKMLNGIIERDGKLYYYEMGRPKAAGLVEVDGDYYFAGGENGEILVNVKQYTWANSTSLPNGTYEFGADGKMLNGIVEKDGTLYYYEMGKTKTAGLIQIDGDYYFAGGANGEITVNKKQYVWQSNGLLPEDNYEFGADGKMLNGFVTRDDGIYYYDTGKYGRVGLNLIDGDYYFVGYYGKLYTNGTYYVWETNGYSICMNYTFDETGKLVK